MSVNDVKYAEDTYALSKGQTTPEQYEEYEEGRAKAISPAEWPAYFRTLSVCLGSGLHIVEAFELLAEQVEDKTLKERSGRIARLLHQGKTLEKALKHLAVLKPFHYQMFLVGKESSQLDSVLNYLADYEEKQYTNTLSTRNALIYPVGISLVVLLLALGLPIYFQDTIVEHLEFFDQKPPLPLQALFMVSNVFQHKYVMISAVVAVALFFLYKIPDKLQIKKNRFKLSRYWSRIPYVKEIRRKISLERFARTLLLQLSTGMPLLAAVKNSMKATDDPIFLDQLSLVEGAIQDGATLNESLARTELFPQRFLSLVTAGEEIGEISKMLAVEVELLNEEVQRTIETSVTLFQPIAFIFLGAMVGGLGYTLLKPLSALVQSL